MCTDHLACFAGIPTSRTCHPTPLSRAFSTPTNATCRARTLRQVPRSTGARRSRRRSSRPANGRLPVPDGERAGEPTNIFTCVPTCPPRPRVGFVWLVAGPSSRAEMPHGPWCQSRALRGVGGAGGKLLTPPPTHPASIPRPSTFCSKFSIPSLQPHITYMHA